MNIIRRIGVLALLLTIAVLSVAPIAEAKKADRVETRLSGSAPYANAKGKAQYGDKRGEREFQAEVEHVTQLQGQTLNVFVNGGKLGSLKVSKLGAGRLNLNSERGNTVPTVNAGTLVEIKTQTGVLIASGRF